jgi:DNA-binding NtrC family response regulator
MPPLCPIGFAAATLAGRNGYVPRSASDSLEASRLLETIAFDVVVSDIMMPNLNGLQLLEAVKRRPGAQVVLVTAYANRKLAVEALEKGASGFIEKAMTSETFLDAVRQAVLRSRLRRPSTGSG